MPLPRRHRSVWRRLPKRCERQWFVRRRRNDWCTDAAACNYNADATLDDGSCIPDVDADGICDDVDPCVGEEDECGVCNGPGAIYACGCTDLPDGDCDCDGNQLDALGVCGGDCAADADSDGVCDDVDDCVGAYDVCGLQRSWRHLRVRMRDIPDVDCDCTETSLDALGVCGETAQPMTMETTFAMRRK